MLTGTLRIADRRLQASIVSARGEADGSSVIRLDFPVEERRAPGIIWIVDLNAVGIAAALSLRIVRVQEETADAEVLRAEEGGRPEQKIGAGCVHGVLAGATRIAAGEKRADIRLSEHAVLGAASQKVLADQGALLSSAHVHGPHVVPANLPRKLAADVDLLRIAGVQPDAPREERQQRVVAVGAALKVEEGRSVEKEVTFLREELRKPFEVGEPLIDFGLREVGIDGQVGAHARRRAVKNVEAGVGAGVDGWSATSRKRLGRANRVRFDVDAVPFADVLQPNK